MKHKFTTLILITGLVIPQFASAQGAEEFEPYLSQESVANSVITLPAPPAPGSAEFLLDELEYHRAKLLRDTPRGRQAVEDAKMDTTVLRQFAEAFGYHVTASSMPRTFRLLMKSKESFGTYGCQSAKEWYMRTRPFMYYGEPTLTPDDEPFLVGNGSFPSGHSSIAYGLACIMISLNPERQDQIWLRAAETAYSRVIVGAHWLSDTKAALVVAITVFARLQADPQYIVDFRLAKDEIDALKVTTRNVSQRDLY